MKTKKSNSKGSHWSAPGSVYNSTSPIQTSKASKTPRKKSGRGR